MEVSAWPKELCACGGKVAECGGHESFCWSCNKHEKQTDATFLVCYECNHVYQTAKDLEDAYMEATGRHVPAHKIFFCQLCIHDF